MLRKARFWDSYARLPTNDRQRAVLNRLLDGFTGTLTTVKQHSETRVAIEFEPLPGAVAVGLADAIEATCRALFPGGVEIAER